MFVDPALVFTLEEREKEGKGEGGKKRREKKEKEKLREEKFQGNPLPHALLTLFTSNYKHPLFAFPPFGGGATGPSIPRYARPDLKSDLIIARHPQAHSPRSL
jgi:hypothetical protein